MVDPGIPVQCERCGCPIDRHDPQCDWLEVAMARQNRVMGVNTPPLALGDRDSGHVLEAVTGVDGDQRTTSILVAFKRVTDACDALPREAAVRVLKAAAVLLGVELFERKGGRG